MNKTTSFNFAFIFSGCFFGAGFVAGTEMRDFFCRYGLLGYFLYAASIVIAAVTSLRLTKLKLLTGESSFEAIVFGKDHAFLIRTAVLIKHLFMLSLVTFCASCTDEILHCVTGKSSLYGGVLLITLNFIISIIGKKSASAVFSLCVPVISIFSLLCCIYCGLHFNAYPSPTVYSLPRMLFSPLLYAGYNILAGIGTAVTDNSHDIISAKKGLLFGSMMLFLCGGAIMKLVFVSSPSHRVPVLELICSHSKAMGICFSALLFLSLTATCISRTAMLADAYSKTSHGRHAFCLGICVCAYLLSLIGFNGIIHFIYPVFGVAGVLSIVIVNIRYKLMCSSDTKLSYAFFRR